MVSSVFGAASVSGTVSLPRSTEREDGKETNKYTANICNTKHAMLTYALFIYVKREKSYGITSVEGHSKETDGAVRFV